MRLRNMIDWNTREPYPCEHPGHHCSVVSYPWPYQVTRAVPHPTDEGVVLSEFIRWSTPDDPPFPCVCDCEPCEDWRQAKAEIDGPVILPTA